MKPGPALLVISLACTGCGAVPQTGAPAPLPGPEPQILPLAPLLAAIPAETAAPTGGSAALVDRAAALRARARAMQGPVSDPETRTRLSERLD